MKLTLIALLMAIIGLNFVVWYFIKTWQVDKAAATYAVVLCLLAVLIRQIVLVMTAPKK